MNINWYPLILQFCMSHCMTGYRHESITVDSIIVTQSCLEDNFMISSFIYRCQLSSVDCIGKETKNPARLKCDSTMQFDYLVHYDLVTKYFQLTHKNNIHAGKKTQCIKNIRFV